MICKTAESRTHKLRSAFRILGCSLIFSSGGKASADMPFLLVQVENLAYLYIQGMVILIQTLGQVLMYRGLGNAEVTGRSPDGGTGFDHVHSQFTGSLVQAIFHSAPLHAVC